MLLDYLNRWAVSQPRATAVIFNDTPISYLDFRNLILGTAHVFHATRFGAGNIVAITCQNLLVNWIAIHALRLLGYDTAVVGSIDALKSLNVDNLAGIVVLRSEANPRTLASLKHFGVPIVPFNDELRSSDRAPPVNRKVGGHILFTSGTTGSYKKAFFEGDKSDRLSLKRVSERNITPASIQHNFNFPQSTGAGFTIPQAIWMAGGCLILDQRPDSELNLFRYPITDAVLVPARAQKLADMMSKSAPRPGSFTLYLGGGAVSRDLADTLKTYVTPNIVILYSATECGNMCETPYTCAEDLVWYLPVAKRRIRIVSDEDGHECAVGEEGRLGVELVDTDCFEYLEDPAATAKAFRNGHFQPGDLAVRRADGRIRVLGRADDVINLRGWKVAVAPLEQKIQAALKVGTVCLFSGLTEDSQDRLVVMIEAVAEPSAQDLALIRKFLHWGEDLRVIVLPEFPRTASATQKLDRIALRRIAFAPQ